MMPLSGDEGMGKKGANSEKSLRSLRPHLQLRKELLRERGWGARELQVGTNREKMRLEMLCSQSTPEPSVVGAGAPGGPTLLFPGPGAPAEGEATSGHWAQEPPFTGLMHSVWKPD